MFGVRKDYKQKPPERQIKKDHITCVRGSMFDTATEIL